MYDCQLSEILVERNENTPFPMSLGQDLIIAGISRPVSCPDDIVPCSVQRINGSTMPALFMTVRCEIAQSPSETGARSREGGRHT